MPPIILTKEQQTIVCAKPAHYVITAVAGSGKTTTLAHRIKYLLDQNYDPKRILILMFNRAARQDFSQKLQQVVGNHSSRPDVRTFHSMGYRLYQRFIKEGYLPTFQTNILSEKEIHFHLWRLICQLLSDESLRDAKRNKKDHVDISHQFIETVKSGLDSPEQVFLKLALDEKFDYLITLFHRFEQWRKQQARISYTDMLYDPVMAIRAHPELDKLVTNKVDVLLVDEYQDTNDIQHELLKRVAGTRADITVVGDPDQTIYEFRGAKPEYILRGFSKEFPDATPLSLSYSFRYGHKISLLANHLISKNFDRRDLLCKSHADNPHTEVQRHSSVEENDAIIQILKKINLDKLNNTAILTRVWSQTVSIELALLQHHIPYHIDGHSGVFNTSEMNSLRCLLEVSAGLFSSFPQNVRQNKLDLLCHFPHAGLPDTQIKMLCANLSRLDNSWGKALLANIPTDLHKVQTLKLERLAQALIKLEKTQGTEKKFLSGQILTNYINDTQLYEGIRSLSLSYDHAEEKINSIKGLVRFVGKLEGDEKSVLAHLNKLQEQSQQQHQHAIHICTIHRAKGLEWDTVLIPGLNDKVLPYSYRPDSLTRHQLESERRLFYVAITRAKLALHLFVPKKQQGAKINKSRFEFELNLKQSLLLGSSLYQCKPECLMEVEEEISEISHRYAKSMSCKLIQNKNIALELLAHEKNEKPVWLSTRVQHCVLGGGEIHAEQANSFSVQFLDKQIRTFSKETADRFFTAIK